MSNAVSAQNTQWSISSDYHGASPNGFVRILEVKTFSADADRPEIDVTNLDSTAREYRLGLRDFGTFSLEMNGINDDPGQLLLDAALSSPNSYDFRILYPDGTVDTFEGLVKQFPRPSGAVDEVLTRTAQIRVTGTITTVVA